MKISQLKKAIEDLQRDYQVSDDAVLMGAHSEPLPLFLVDGERLFGIKEDGVYEVVTC